MKKQYQKPTLFYEDFALMDAITTSCILIGDHADKYHCHWYNEDFDWNIYVMQFVLTCEADEIGEITQDVVFPS